MQSVFETGSSALSRQDKETRPGPACSGFPVLQRVCAWQAMQRFPESGGRGSWSVSTGPALLSAFITPGTQILL